jgi:hypothetical protein
MALRTTMPHRHRNMTTKSLTQTPTTRTVHHPLATTVTYLTTMAHRIMARPTMAPITAHTVSATRDTQVVAGEASAAAVSVAGDDVALEAADAVASVDLAASADAADTGSPLAKAAKRAAGPTS